MQTSDKGIAYLDSREGVVLRAYRDPTGKWTIGAGLTAASGVVTPKAGMVITRAEADRLMAAALKHNYEPAVAKAMVGASQHAFDGGVSFHWNTGAIGRASWVTAWRKGDRQQTRSRLLLWTKSRGKVLPGLERRRREEADIILRDKWPADLRLTTAVPSKELGWARFVISVSVDDIARIRDGFREAGFNPGPIDGQISRAAVIAFQTRYGLTADGLIGKVTLSTLQREIDARAKGKKGATGAAGGGAVAGGGQVVSAGHGMSDQLATWIGLGIGVLALVWLAYLAWHYRDMIAARLQAAAPKLAAWLRSF